MLQDVTYGIVFLFEGGATPNVNANNVFICDKERPYIDESTKQPLCPTQKPINFITKLVDLFTVEGDWIFDGLGGIGKINHILCINCMVITTVIWEIFM